MNDKPDWSLVLLFACLVLGIITSGLAIRNLERRIEKLEQRP